MNKIEQLRKLKVVGNAHSDRQLFDLAHDIIMDESQDMISRIEAVHKIDDAMGESQQFYSEDDVHEYVRIESE